jgi:hypothetical protein
MKSFCISPVFFPRPYRRNSLAVRAYVCCSFILSSQSSYTFLLNVFVQRTNLNGGIHKGLWLNDPIKPVKCEKRFFFHEIRVGVLQTKSRIFTSLSRVLSQKV